MILLLHIKYKENIFYKLMFLEFKNCNQLKIMQLKK